MNQLSTFPGYNNKTNSNTDVKIYITRIKNWKIRNMVMLYLEARDKFKKYRKVLRRGNFLSFERMRELSDILFEIKEDHHLIFKRLLDPKKNRFESAPKLLPDAVELEFMNNVGLLFHKMLVARELKYLLEHYVEQSELFTKNTENLQLQLKIINNLFDDGIEILKSLISHNNDNMLLLTLLLEDTKCTKRHFGENAVRLVERFGAGKGLADIYFSVGQYYVKCGRQELAKRMLQNALRKNEYHKQAQDLLKKVNAAGKNR